MRRIVVGRPKRIIPAYAGSTVSRPSGVPWRADHPRIRGEHYVNSVYPALAAGSSPHTRGALDVQAGHLVEGRDHPRIRGEHSLRGPAPRPAQGSSPHTRGARLLYYDTDSVIRIIPAYAGSTSQGSGE